MRRQTDMTMANPNIDGGKEFDWGRVSAEYAKYRDIYPPEFYDRILARSLCRKGQSCLDIGTGTGVLPRNLYRYGAAWTATDISENQNTEFSPLLQPATATWHYWISE